MWKQTPTSNPNVHQLYKYKVLVPTYPPEDVMIDEEGRKWAKQEDSVHDFFEWEGDYWFVWFKKSFAPREGDLVFDKTVEKVFRYRDLKRAVVVFKE